MKRLTRSDLAGLETSALFSDDMLYRYDLSWRWSGSPPLVAWMLNPSTADHNKLDNTIKGLRSRAEAWSHGGVRVINLFAIRATDRDDMKAHPDPVGPGNDDVIRAVLQECRSANWQVIAGWGNDGLHLSRQAEALAIAREVGVDLYTLQKTKEDCPGHPLYIGHAKRPVLWRAANG